MLTWLTTDTCHMLSDVLGVSIDFQEVRAIYCKPHLVPIVGNETELDKALRPQQLDKIRHCNRENFTAAISSHLPQSGPGCIIF